MQNCSAVYFWNYVLLYCDFIVTSYTFTHHSCVKYINSTVC